MNKLEAGFSAIYKRLFFQGSGTGNAPTYWVYTLRYLTDGYVCGVRQFLLKQQGKCPPCLIGKLQNSK